MFTADVSSVCQRGNCTRGSVNGRCDAEVADIKTIEEIAIQFFWSPPVECDFLYSPIFKRGLPNCVYFPVHPSSPGSHTSLNPGAIFLICRQTFGELPMCICGNAQIQLRLQIPLFPRAADPNLGSNSPYR